MDKAAAAKRSMAFKARAFDAQTDEARESVRFALRGALSFTGQDPSGAGVNWIPGTANQWEDGLKQGRMRFAELAVVARMDPEAAREAIRFALTSPVWGKRVQEGWGTEDGFAEALAEAVVDSLTRSKQAESRGATS